MQPWLRWSLLLPHSCCSSRSEKPGGSPGGSPLGMSRKTTEKSLGNGRTHPLAVQYGNVTPLYSTMRAEEGYTNSGNTTLQRPPEMSQTGCQEAPRPSPLPFCPQQPGCPQLTWLSPVPKPGRRAALLGQDAGRCEQPSRLGRHQEHVPTGGWDLCFPRIVPQTYSVVK